MKKVGKTTRSFRYDLNQIPYDYTVEVRNRFKGLDLIDRGPDELQNEARDTAGDRDQDHPHGKEMQKNQNQIDYTLCIGIRSSIQSAKIRLGADCGSDHELLIAKFRFN